jgi:hypothetical protein
MISAIDHRCGPARIGVQILHGRLDVLVSHKIPRLPQLFFLGKSKKRLR